MHGRNSGLIYPGWMGPVRIIRSRMPADPVPVAGAELLVNGNFSAWTADNPDGWTIRYAESGTDYVAESTGRARIVASTLNQGPLQTIVPSGYFLIAYNVVSIAGGGSFGAAIPGIGSIYADGTTGNKLVTYRNSTGFVFGLLRTAGIIDAIVDDASVKSITLSSILSTRTYASANCDLSAAITRTANTQAGLCARLDSATSPANFVIAYLDGGGNVKVDKCVAGVYTNVISGAVSYVAGRVLRLVCSGNSVSAYYNGAQVGATQTVSDAGIVSNTRHGKFSTYAGNVLANYTAA